MRSEPLRKGLQAHSGKSTGSAAEGEDRPESSGIRVRLLSRRKAVLGGTLREKSTRRQDPVYVGNARLFQTVVLHLDGPLPKDAEGQPRKVRDRPS